MGWGSPASSDKKMATRAAIFTGRSFSNPSGGLDPDRFDVETFFQNRFGRQERNGKGLAYWIDRAIDADIPVVVAVASKHFADWIEFAGGMSVKLNCGRGALDAWWAKASMRSA
jgi:Protein of unknown function (DUF2478)